MSESPVIALDGIRVERDGHTLLDNITWTMESGEHWAILGPNGSGKTTLLKILCGHMAPTAGTLRLFGKTYGRTDWNLVRNGIGMVSHSLGTRIENHETALNVVLSGQYGQINFWGSATERERKRAARMLQDVGCSDKESQTWETLSQGERQRLLIGRALMRRVKLLILDEPCAGLDPVAREAFIRFLGRLIRSGKIPGCLFVTHHVEEILPAFQNVLCLSGGRVVGCGKRDAVMVPAVMKRAYGSRVRLDCERGRYQMKVSTGRAGVFHG